MRCLARVLKDLQWVENRLNDSCNEIYEHGANPYGTTAAPDCFPIQTTADRTEFVLLLQKDTLLASARQLRRYVSILVTK
jgi:hypothetical protein